MIDGAIDTGLIRGDFPGRHALKDQQGILSPEHSAGACRRIHQQPRDAWTFETVHRPWLEIC